MDTSSTDQQPQDDGDDIESICDTPKNADVDRDGYKRLTDFMVQWSCLNAVDEQTPYAFLLLTEEGVEITGLDKKTASECFKRLTDTPNTMVSFAPWDDPPEEERFRVAADVMKRQRATEFSLGRSLYPSDRSYESLSETFESTKVSDVALVEYAQGWVAGATGVGMQIVGKGQPEKRQGYKDGRGAFFEALTRRRTQLLWSDKRTKAYEKEQAKHQQYNETVPAEIRPYLSTAVCVRCGALVPRAGYSQPITSEEQTDLLARAVRFSREYKCVCGDVAARAEQQAKQECEDPALKEGEPSASGAASGGFRPLTKRV